MCHLNGIYTQRFNRLENRDGALFRGRYKAILIKDENYLLQVNRYIHLNPLDANIVKYLKYYEWSSYRYYINTIASPHWLCTSYILSFFNNTKDYEDYLFESVDIELKNFYHSKSPILGDNKFVIENINGLDDQYKSFVSTDVNRAIRLYKIEEICGLVTKYFNIDINALKKPYKNNYPRMLAIYLVRNLTQSSHQKISDFFSGIKRESVSSTILKCKSLIDKDISIKQHYHNLLKKIQDES